MVAAKNATVGGAVGLFVVLVANMYMGWWAWHRARPIARFKRLPAWGVVNLGFAIVSATGLLNAATDRLGLRKSVGRLVLLPVVVVGFVVVAFGVINLVRPRPWLEAGARSGRRRG